MDSMRTENKNDKKMDNKNSNVNDNTKNKNLFLCFGPITIDDLDDQIFTYISGSEKKDLFFPKILSPPPTTLAPDKKDEHEKGAHGRRKKDRRNATSILKALFTGTCLPKKVRRRKSGQSSLSLEAYLAAKSAKKNSVKQNDKKLRINSNSRSLSQRCKSQRHENSNDIGEGRYGLMIALCMPLISLLLVLICWGTFFSILCTSMGLFLIRWSLWTLKIDSDEYNYKKRVIREGLLQRNRTRPF